MKSVGNENKKKRNRVIIGSAVGVSLAFSSYAVFDAMSPRDKAEDTTEAIVVETSEEMMTTGALAQALASSETTAVEVTEATTEEIEDEMTTEVESTERADEEDEDDTENDTGNGGNGGNTSGNSSNGSTGNAGNGGNTGNSGNNSNGSTGNTSGNGGNTGNSGNGGSSTGNDSTGNTGDGNTGNGGSSTTTTETTESDEPSYGDLIWVVDQEGCWVEVPIIENKTIYVCNNCGADITDNPDAHSTPELIMAGCGAWHTETIPVQTGTELVWQEEQGHWERYGY